MRIKRLEVTGFKSFCDRTVVRFDEPITAVVGPNGCGKSNIVDAIRWCMGEQSAKHLRGKAMDDVIFAGSDSRGPVGMCEVTLVFENDGQVPIEYLAYSEIAVTRKLYRDGTSEYFLNKTPCRLRDVVDFFLGTGIGAKAYSIIEQGRVGMIVSSKPEDRRMLIEEAAGITKFKLKKRQAEKKMDATRQNLLRVSDVVTEIEKQLGSLRRQAQKAERYRQYKGELRDIELCSASQRWLGLVVEERVVADGLDESTTKRDAIRTDLVTKEATLEAHRLSLAHDERLLTERQGQLYELDNRVRLEESEAEHEEREALACTARATEAQSEIAQLVAGEAETEASLTQVLLEQSELAQLMAGQAEVLATREEALRAQKAALSGVQERIAQTRTEVGQCQADIAHAEGAERAAVRRRDDLNVRLSRLAEEQARIDERQGLLRGDSERLVGKLTELKQLSFDLTEERARSEARSEVLRAELAVSKGRLDKLTAELNRLTSRRASLEELHARYEGFQNGTRTVLQHPEARWGVRGALADLIETPAAYEAAVEAVLAERLGAVVVESQEAGLDAIEYLKSASAGRATFVPANRFSGTGSTPPEGALIKRVTVSDELSGLAEHLFAEVVVVDDLLGALDRWRSGERRMFVTLAGEVLSEEGGITGGSREAAAASVLAQKREIRELADSIAVLETEVAQVSAEHTANEQERTTIMATLETLRHDAHQSEMALLTHDKELARANDELERICSRLQDLAGEQQELGHQHSEAVAELQGAQTKRQAGQDLLLAAEDGLSQLAHEQVAVLGEVETAQTAVTASKIESAQATEKQTALTQTVTRIEAEKRERAARKERLETTIGESDSRAQSLRQGAAGRRETLLGLVSDRARLGTEIDAERIAQESRRLELAESETSLKELRRELDALHEVVGELEIKHHDLVSGRAHLEEAIMERYRLALPTEVQTYHLRPLVTAAEEERARELRDLIDRMGEINLRAIEEYNELEARFTFLVTQRGDLEQAIAQLEEAIERINKTSKARFREVFDLVNTKFQEIFPRCFRGGQARLVLTDEDNLLESGIEIVAQPPGKKNSTVEVLSGGEKAMTAVALIFAIFLIKPSPFCLLDEVDAPLDEANVGRYNDLIRELTDRSQFIVITHNKRTMQVADTLYGVTMEEPGVSKLVSVNLNQIGKDGTTRSRAVQAA